MSATRSLWSVTFFVVMMFKFSPVAEVINCRNGNPAGLDLGTVTPGQTETIATRFSSTCNSYDGQAEYVRACLKVIANSPLVMSRNGLLGIPLYFSVHPICNRHSPLSQNSNVYAQIDFVLSTGGTVEHDISFADKINPSQTNVSAGVYHDYSTATQTTYTSTSSLQVLPARGVLNGTTVINRISTSAMVKNGYEVVNVDDMTFGDKSPVQSGLLQATSTVNITIQYPTGTDYPVSIGHGLRPKRNQRSMCHNGECVNYALYQGAAHSMEWTRSNLEKQYSTDGQAQSPMVYDSIPAQKWPSPGDYIDTTVITLTY